MINETQQEQAKTHGQDQKDIARLLLDMYDVVEPVNEASDLIRRAAKLGILHMPDSGHVVVCREYFGDEIDKPYIEVDETTGQKYIWEATPMLEASIGLSKEPDAMDMLRSRIAEEEKTSVKVENKEVTTHHFG